MTHPPGLTYLCNTENKAYANLILDCIKHTYSGEFMLVEDTDHMIRLYGKSTSPERSERDLSFFAYGDLKGLKIGE